MKIEVTVTRIDQLTTPLMAVPVSKPPPKDPLFRALSSAMDGRLRRLAEQEHFKGEMGQTLCMTGFGHVGAQRLMLIGAGDETKGHACVRLRTVAAQAARWVRTKGLKRFAVALPAVDGVDGEDAVRWLAEGVLLGAYCYSLKTGDGKPHPEPTRCAIVLPTDGDRATPISSLSRAISKAQAAARGVELARDLVNTPANELGPAALAKKARELAARRGCNVRVFRLAEIAKRGMRLLAAVGGGSRAEPRFIHLTYKPRRKRIAGRLALVGKGITFDSGGLALKPASSQPDMKSDMAGAATVLGTLEMAALLRLPWQLEAIVPACENMPSGRAYRPGDVIGSLAGKTVEVRNTDAEGRLVLADALAYARRLGPDAIIDVATLTGACMVALGPYTAGLFSNSDPWAVRLLEAAQRAGEDVWRMPLTGALVSHLKSDVADLKNLGTRWGGAITAALFLKEFVGDTAWMHLDIAGPAFLEKHHQFHPKGGTGFGVLTMAELLSHGEPSRAEGR